MVSSIRTKIEKPYYKKRKPLEVIKEFIELSGFKVISVNIYGFCLRFADAETMFNHSLIKYWLMGSWKEILRKEDTKEIFRMIEKELNEIAELKGEISLEVPCAVIESAKI